MCQCVNYFKTKAKLGSGWKITVLMPIDKDINMKTRKNIKNAGFFIQRDFVRVLMSHRNYCQSFFSIREKDFFAKRRLKMRNSIFVVLFLNLVKWGRK